MTEPNGKQPPIGENVFGRGPGGHGHDELWTNVWTWGEGVVLVPPTHVQPDGSLGGMKWPWWRDVPGELTIEGHRLDADAPPLQADIPDGYGETGFQVSGLIFPTTGCWQVTGRVGDVSLTFVVLVKRVNATGTPIALIFALLVAYVLFPWPIPPAASFELIAHRGVHQTFPLTNLRNDTCTGEIIYPPTHDFIENTVPSMREAFAKGATAVELDIHRTADDQLVVFHDWTLDCRTDGTGITNEQPLAYLETLDIGYGYTADGGQTFPLRGKGVGMMPTLPEVLAAFPAEHLIIHDKDGDAETRQLLVDVLGTLPPARRARLTYWGGEGFAPLHERFPEIQPLFYSQDELQACLGDYLLRMLFTGSLPDHCRQQIIGIPYRLLPSIPGWPNLILARAHQAGARVFITDVDTVEQLDTIVQLPIDGIQTNLIEVIGPLVGKSASRRERTIGQGPIAHRVPSEQISHGPTN